MAKPWGLLLAGFVAAAITGGAQADEPAASASIPPPPASPPVVSMNPSALSPVKPAAPLPKPAELKPAHHATEAKPGVTRRATQAHPVTSRPIWQTRRYTLHAYRWRPGPRKVVRRYYAGELPGHYETVEPAPSPSWYRYYPAPWRGPW